MALTVTSNLLSKYKIDPKSVGRLEVGTETLLDKSKSVKSVLMQLFGDNTNLEGVDTINACYGGTNALFNSVNWVESSAWDGRDAIVVAGDIALYAKGNARPTGGAGAVAMLIGPDAPLAMETSLRGTYMQHAYDFYKPDLTSEYPYVDGHFSLTCYTKALDAAYRDYCRREAKSATNGHATGDKTPFDRFDYMAFHAPTCKLVQKSYARLLYHDFLDNANAPVFAEVAPELRDMDYEKSLTDKLVEKTFMGLAKKKFQERVDPGIQVATKCGNMYCASVWGGLVSLLGFVDSKALEGKRIGVFSYGSGLASSFMSFRVNGSVQKMAEVLDVPARLEARRCVPPETYEQVSSMESVAATMHLLTAGDRCASCASRPISKRTTPPRVTRRPLCQVLTTSKRSTTCSSANTRSRHKHGPTRRWMPLADISFGSREDPGRMQEGEVAQQPHAGDHGLMV